MSGHLFELIGRHGNLCFNMGFNSVADWCIEISDKRGVRIGDAKVFVRVQDCCYNLAMAKAYVELCEYLSETRGGY